MTERVSDPSPSKREIRIALVLYGGVSLAIYENGVARTFWELVKARGAFGPLLELLDAHARVDVIAGTSAGGINGLMLAAAIESGADFTQTEELWRELGDLGALLRPASDDSGKSLLKGETYYQDQLVAAFERLCRVEGEPPDPGEIDVFITGTDLAGHARSYVDGLGARITDKQHRLVFQLKHRPGRRALGLTTPKRPAKKRDEPAPEAQATILAAVARITSCFPLAFPPFQLDQIRDEGTREKVECALRGMAYEFDPAHALVDGGVLDNKPFGPALRAIFYRMPDGLPVDRRLFYVEPDPGPRLPTGPAAARAGANGASTPAKVGVAALTSIPAHEGIGDDLDRLREHNARLAWMRSVRESAQAALERASGRALEQDPVYRRVRAWSLALSLASTSEETPSATDAPRERAFEQGVVKWIEGNPDLDAFDVDFQLRRVFDSLYRYYQQLKGPPGDPSRGPIVQRLSRMVKTLEVIRSQMLALRDLLNEKHPPIAARAAAFAELLAASSPCYREALDSLALEAPLDSRVLSELHANLGKDVRRCLDLAEDPRVAFTGFGPTILSALAEAASRWTAAADPAKACFDRFDHLDRILFPLSFSSGAHELDEIEFVRISPQDAQRELSEGDYRAKVAGDELGHFSAFLRRDWRSADILWGRVDALALVIESLLDDERLGRLCEEVRAGGRLDAAFDGLAAALPNAPPRCIEEVANCWRALLAAWRSSGRSAALEGELLSALVRAAQEDAVASAIEGVAADTLRQDQLFQRPIHKQASRKVRAGEPGRSFKEWAIGNEAAGERVPAGVMGEYAAQAYLHLWHMLAASMGANRGLLGGRVRLVFYHPIAYLRAVLALVRGEPGLGWLLLAASPLALGAISVVLFLASEAKYAGAALLAALFFAWLIARLAPETPAAKRRWWGAIALLCGVAAAASLGTALPIWWERILGVLGR